MPCERARALRFAGEVLRDILASDDVPAELKRQAMFALRHYPSADEIALYVRLPEFRCWLEPEDKYGPT